jgi:hypothetical protein
VPGGFTPEGFPSACISSAATNKISVSCN